LRHRDLIGLGAGARAFYSTERRARVEPFPGINGRPAKCARCKDDIEPGAPSVQCPQIECSLWYHQSEERPCWTYTGACGPCGQPTSFSADFRWTPMEL
jgi:hypothetical protein